MRGETRKNTSLQEARWFRRKLAKEHLEDDDGGPVVQQALSFDQGAQLLGHTLLARRGPGASQPADQKTLKTDRTQHLCFVQFQVFFVTTEPTNQNLCIETT